MASVPSQKEIQRLTYIETDINVFEKEFIYALHSRTVDGRIMRIQVFDKF